MQKIHVGIVLPNTSFRPFAQMDKVQIPRERKNICHTRAISQLTWVEIFRWQEPRWESSQRFETAAGYAYTSGFLQRPGGGAIGYKPLLPHLVTALQSG